jgi:hypothetical protein
MAQIKPEDWNNIAIPVVNAVKALIQECEKMTAINKMESKRLQMLE